MGITTWATPRHLAQFGSASVSSGLAPPSSRRWRRGREIPSPRAASERLPPAAARLARGAARWVSAGGAGEGRALAGPDRRGLTVGPPHSDRPRGGGRPPPP